MKKKKSNQIIFSEASQALKALLEGCDKSMPRIREIQIYLLEETPEGLALSLEWKKEYTKLKKRAERWEGDIEEPEMAKSEKPPTLLN